MKFALLFTILFLLVSLVQGFPKNILPDDPNSISSSSEYLKISDYDFINYTEKNGLVYNGILKFAFDPQGYAWIATGNDVDPKSGGLSILTPNNYFLSYRMKDGLPDNRINDILILPLKKKDIADVNKGGIWFATGYGIAQLDRKGKWTIYDKANSRLPDNRVTSLILDDDNNIWVSTLGGGVVMIDPDGNWNIYNRNNGLAGNKVAAGFKDKRGHVWFGIWDGGISKLEENQFVNYSMGNSGLVSNSITSIAQNPLDSTMWFATSEGLSVFDGEKWITYNSQRDKFLINNFITSLAFEKNGNLWIGYWGEGITVLKPDGTFENIRSDNSKLLDNHVGTIAIDRFNNKWFGTYKGFSIILSGENETGRLLGDAVYPDYYSFTGREGTYEKTPEDFNASAYHWQLADNTKRGRRTLCFALPIEHYGKVKWSYSAFWGQDALWKSGAMDYSITQDRIGNTWAEFSGEFKEADFLSYGYVTEYTVPKIDPAKTYRFPDKYPDAVKKYLVSGIYLPSDNPDVYKKVTSIVKEKSKKDMYLTVLDILYSNLFRDMPYDYSVPANEDPSDSKFVTSTAKEVAILDPAMVLSKNKGVGWSKARLFCSMCKAVGVPARIVVGNGPHVWSEVWINGPGWIPVETSLPVYDYAAANRLSFPKIFSDARIPVTSFSGNDDDTKSIDWYPQVKAVFKHLNNPKALRKLSKLSLSKLLILKPVKQNDLDDIPIETMVPVSKGHYMIVEALNTVDTIWNNPDFPETKMLHEFFSPGFLGGKKTYNNYIQEETPEKENNIHEVVHDIPSEKPSDMTEPEQTVTPEPDVTRVPEVINYRLLIYDEQHKVIEAVNLTETGKLVSIRREGNLVFEFIPARIGEYLILEIHNWAVIGDDIDDTGDDTMDENPSETPVEGTPTPGPEQSGDLLHEITHNIEE